MHTKWVLVGLQMTAKMGERDSREEILKAFRLFDDDGSGTITLKDLRRVAKELGENLTGGVGRNGGGKGTGQGVLSACLPPARLADEQCLVRCRADEELQEMIDEADRDGDGEINEDEFIR